jgi:hypothetical protein
MHCEQPQMWESSKYEIYHNAPANSAQFVWQFLATKCSTSLFWLQNSAGNSINGVWELLPALAGMVKQAAS